MFISIITVCFNSANTIERTIKSILNQSFKDYEYIIVDGGSKDGTLDIIRKYEPLFEGRLVWTSEPDKGIYDAMNKGCKKANGEYVWIVNSDDWAENNALEQLFQYTRQNGNDCQSILAAGLNIIEHESLKLISQTFCSNEYYISRCNRLDMGLSHPSIVVPKIIYEQLGYYDDRYYISADVDFILRCYRAKVPILFPQIIISNMTDGGISNAFNLKKNLHDYNIRLEKFCPDKLKKIRYRAKYIARIFILNHCGTLSRLYIKCKR